MDSFVKNLLIYNLSQDVTKLGKTAAKSPQRRFQGFCRCHRHWILMYQSFNWLSHIPVTNEVQKSETDTRQKLSHWTII